MRKFAYIPSILIAGAIVFLSSMPKPPVSLDLFIFQDKLAHLVAYFTLSFSVIFGIYYNSKKIPYKKILVITFIIVALFGASDEYHQSYVPGRDASFWDWAFDVIGAVLAAVLYKRINQKIVNLYKRIRN